MTYQYKIIYKEHSRLFGETTSQELVRAHSMKKAISKFRTTHRYEDIVSIDGNVVDPRIMCVVNGS